MHKLLLSVAVAAASILTGCVSSDSYENPYAPIMPGIQIHGAGWEQTNLALDPAGVALRLEMLLAQAEAEDKPINQLEGKYKGVSYNLKDGLLFGIGTTIASSGEGVYTITYTGNSKGALDYFYRRGCYVIDTHGVRLTEAVDTPWTITQDKMECWTTDSYGNRTQYDIYAWDAISIRRNGLVYEIVGSGFEASLLNYKNFTSDWDSNFKWQVELPEKSEDDLKIDQKYDLRYSLVAEGTFLLYGGGSGTVFSSFNGVNPASMTYNVSITSPLKWIPSKTQYYNQVVSGVETVTLTSPSDYNASDYPSPKVVVTRTLKDQLVSTQVSYNGVSLFL